MSDRPHRRYTSADDAAHRYVELAGRVGLLRAQDITMGARIEWSRECPNPSCQRMDTKSEAFRREINGVERCNRCRNEWPQFEVGSLGVSVRSSGEGIARRMHGEHAEKVLLAVVLHERPRNITARTWAAMHAAWALALYGRRDSGLYAAARKAISRAGGTSDRTLDGYVRGVREEVEGRLATRGLLDYGGGNGIRA